MFRELFYQKGYTRDFIFDWTVLQQNSEKIPAQVTALTPTQPQSSRGRDLSLQPTHGSTDESKERASGTGTAPLPALTPSSALNGSVTGVAGSTTMSTSHASTMRSATSSSKAKTGFTSAHAQRSAGTSYSTSSLRRTPSKQDMLNDLKRMGSSPERVSTSEKDKTTVSVHPRRSSGHRPRTTVGDMKDDRDKNGDSGSAPAHHSHSHTHGGGDLTPVGSNSNIAAGSINSMGVMGSIMAPSERLGSLSISHSGVESPVRSLNVGPDVLGSVAGTPGSSRNYDISSSAPASTTLGKSSTRNSK